MFFDLKIIKKDSKGYIEPVENLQELWRARESTYSKLYGKLCLDLCSKYGSCFCTRLAGHGNYHIAHAVGDVMPPGDVIAQWGDEFEMGVEKALALDLLDKRRKGVDGDEIKTTKKDRKKVVRTKTPEFRVDGSKSSKKRPKRKEQAKMAG